MILNTLQVQQEQAQQELRTRETAYTFATVGTVHKDGVTLIFPGETAPSKKHYPCSSNTAFTAGQRVYITKAAGTYIVVCPILGGS